jgi:two-component system response regulator MprA
MPQTVLVVDDDRELADVLADALAELGYMALCAHDGEGAMRSLAESRPAAIILDLLMPRMDGLAFLGSRLRDDRLAEIPVIVLSGQREMTQRARALDADVVLEKPVKLLILLGAIQQVLDEQPPSQRDS